MSQRGFTETGRTVKQYVIQRFASAFGSGDSYVQIFLDSILPDEVVKATGAQVSIEWCIFSAGFAGYYASYFALPPQINRNE